MNQLLLPFKGDGSTEIRLEKMFRTFKWLITYLHAIQKNIAAFILFWFFS